MVAKLLANLAIDKWNAKILDPAYGKTGQVEHRWGG
jgi:hypothetical protein